MEAQMAKAAMRFGGLYLAYEVGSTILLFAFAAYGLNFPGF